GWLPVWRGERRMRGGSAVRGGGWRGFVRVVWVPGAVGGCAVRAHRRRALRGRAGVLVAAAVAGAGVQARSWQRVRGPGGGWGQRGGAAGSAGRGPAAVVAAGVRGRWHQLAAVRCGALPGPGVLLSPLAAWHGQADRGGLAVPAGQPAEL